MPIHRITSGMNHSWAQLQLLNGMNGQGGLPGLPAGANNQLNAMLISAAGFVANAGPRAAQLRGTLGGLQGVLDRLTAASGNTNALVIRSFTGNALPETSVLIEQIAKTQRNEGTAARADARDMDGGSFRFEIKLDGGRHEISFTADEGMTNRAFQQRMADAINQANVGVGASVTTANGESRLILEAAATGAGEDGPRFTVTDIHGGAVAALGADFVARQGQNALFSINGGERLSSASNDVNLGGGLNVTLLAASDEAVAITPRGDSLAIRGSVRQVVSQFNALLEAARGNSIDRNTRALVRELEAVIRRNRRALNEIGVSVSPETGLLAINEDRLRAASENGAAAGFLGSGAGRPSGFVGALSRIAENVSANPARHISRHVTRLPAFNAALQMAARGNSASQPPSPFDAYFANDALSSLINALR